ncbi:MAG: hypothetical protein A2086_03075 [Spirochaetes bacterium GWD1_27_9]|nr:MAG: hypothetical protein A2Z98_18740 [Spirochaetes bacterium GWB1_27_13]OHD23011.1 MAG: hypothetical protein A2Y34_00120 [Spirochaetes bacterium GWC1_27_15]OHD39606.1 MAG: hypothetical protein A2086_03075 [Spirochaetes bacterium GWD1_27_9]
MKIKMFLILVLIIFIIIFINTNCQPLSEVPVDSQYADMVEVKGGTFNMGGIDEPTSTPKDNVSVKDFYIGKYELSYSFWYSVKKWNNDNSKGYYLSNLGREGDSFDSNGNPTKKDGDEPSSTNEPVANITSIDARIWCNILSEKEKLTPVYYTDQNFKYVMKSNSLFNGQFYIKQDANGYRLPTEAEWEYAARYIDGTNWTKASYLSGASSDGLDAKSEVAVFGYYSKQTDVTKSAPVGSKKPNSLGLYDMSGNIEEWCEDYYDNSGYYVLKGGCWRNASSSCTVSYRAYNWRGTHQTYAGFRLARNY